MLRFREFLEALDESRLQPVPQRQPFADYSSAKAMAEEREYEFNKILQFAASGGGKVITDVKSQQSFEDKTINRGKDPGHVWDMLRGAILVREAWQIPVVVKRLRKRTLVSKVDYKNVPTVPAGYYGACHVDIVIDGLVAEVQIATLGFWSYKQEAHKLYDKHRGQEAPTPEYEKDMAKSRHMFLMANKPKAVPKKQAWQPRIFNGEDH